MTCTITRLKRGKLLLLYFGNYSLITLVKNNYFISRTQNTSLASTKQWMRLCT